MTSLPKIHKTREQKERVNPDVVFQFSWGNGEGYQIEAIDEMMNRALVVYVPHQPNNEAPRLGFLVKLRTHGPNKGTRDDWRKLREVDVYRIPRGTTFEDAKASRNGASHASYAAGQQDVVLEITAQDLGIEGFWRCFVVLPTRFRQKLYTRRWILKLASSACLSTSMMVAQEIFRYASRPFGFLAAVSTAATGL